MAVSVLPVPAKISTVKFAKIPSTEAFENDQTLLPFWSDIDTESGLRGEIYWDQIGDVLIFQWQDVGFAEQTDTATFQIKVFGSENPALAQFIYKDIEQFYPDGGRVATIGYQDGKDGFFNTVQWSFDEENAVGDDTVLSLVAPAAIPEPTTFALMGLGLAGIGYRRQHNKKAV